MIEKNISINEYIEESSVSEYRIKKGIYYNPDMAINLQNKTRDRQSEGYLRHKKHLVHKDVMNRWLTQLPKSFFNKGVLDLGCGPGPNTRLLVKNGFEKVLAIDGFYVIKLFYLKISYKVAN